LLLFHQALRHLVTRKGVQKSLADINNEATYDSAGAYGASKLYNILFTKSLAESGEKMVLLRFRLILALLLQASKQMQSEFYGIHV